MDANDIAEKVSFGRAHFGGCDLGDKRLTERAVRVADRFLEHPGGTLPEKLNANADLIGFYRLANNPKVTHAKLLGAHCARTRRLMEQATGIILVVHDTTELDFSGLDVEELGPIGHGGEGACRGYLCHNSLAYGYEAREVLGLVHQTLHVRREVPKGESPKAKREHPRRESRLWTKGRSALGPAPRGRLRVNIGDRGADLFEFIEAVERGEDHYVIRSKSNRNIEINPVAGGVTHAKLHDGSRQLPRGGTRTVQTQAQHGTTARAATVSVAAGAVTIKVPHFARGEHSARDLRTWVVCVREIDPPAGVEPLEWILLTNIPIDGFACACRRVDWYACRPMIEEYHKAQKTGCGIELPQFTTGHALAVAIAMQSVVATQLLRLRDLSRRADAATRRASQVVDEPYVQAMGVWRFKELRPHMSVQEFCLALAKLGGHLNRTHDKPPGWLVLWRGWTKLQLMVEGIQAAARISRCV